MTNLAPEMLEEDQQRLERILPEYRALDRSIKDEADRLFAEADPVPENEGEVEQLRASIITAIRSRRAKDFDRIHDLANELDVIRSRREAAIACGWAEQRLTYSGARFARG